MQSVLTTLGGDVQVLRALKAGAQGYLLRNLPHKELAVAGNRRPRYADFESRDALLKALHSAVPRFDDSRVSINVAGGTQTSIVLAGEMDLDDNQLSILGLS